MLRIKEDKNIEDLEKYDYQKHGGTEKCWHFYYYTKEIYGPMNCYLIKIDAYTREILIFKNLSFNKSFANVKAVNKKRLVKDLIVNDMVERI